MSKPETPFFILRPALSGDAESITKLFILTRETSMAFLEWTYDYNYMLPLFRDRWLPIQIVWVAESEGVIVGFAALEGEDLDRLYVLPAFQGKGIGRALLDKIKSLCPNRLGLWVFQENQQARRFYERNGFVLQHLTDGRDNMEKTPDARYLWSR